MIALSSGTTQSCYWSSNFGRDGSTTVLLGKDYWLFQCRQPSALVSLSTNCLPHGTAEIHWQMQNLLPTQWYQALFSVVHPASLAFCSQTQAVGTFDIRLHLSTPFWQLHYHWCSRRQVDYLDNSKGWCLATCIHSLNSSVHSFYKPSVELWGWPSVYKVLHICSRFSATNLAWHQNY